MTEGLTIKVEGIKELQAKFKVLDVSIQNIMSQAVSQGAAVVERDAKQRVRVRTGRLRNSIREMKQTKTASRVESQVGTDVEYGPANEFGSARLSAQPFLRPAIDNNEAEIVAAVEQAIVSVLGRYK